MFSRILALTVLLTTFLGAQATIYVTNPVSGGTYSAGQSITVSWLDDGEAPLVNNIGSCNVALYMGDGVLVQQIAQVDVADANSLTFSPNAAAGPNSGDYYVQFSSVNPVNGATYLQYSPSFALTGMSGNSGSQVPSLTSAVPTVIASSVASAATSAASSGSAISSAASSAASSISSIASASSSLSSAASSVASSISSAGSSVASSVSSAESSATGAAASSASSALSSISAHASSALSSLSSGFSSVRSPSGSATMSPSASVMQSSSAAVRAADISLPFTSLCLALAGVVAGAAML